jgi:carboxyl-terminal processing protease
VQNIFELEGGRSALKLTTAGYLRPSGKNIDKPKDGKDEDTWGVLPNDGFQVALNDEETARLFELRRKRDRIPIAGQGKTAAGPTASEPQAPAGTTPDDPQLRRAIDYLTKQLAARS